MFDRCPLAILRDATPDDKAWTYWASIWYIAAKHGNLATYLERPSRKTVEVLAIFGNTVAECQLAAAKES